MVYYKIFISNIHVNNNNNINNINNSSAHNKNTYVHIIQNIIKDMNF